MTTLPVSFKDVLAASDRISSYVHRTPVVTSRSIDDVAGIKLFFKCENLQKTGAFKARGATNALLKAKEEGRVPEKGVIAYSSGNHGIALSRICAKVGVPCTIVLPLGCPDVKWKRMADYGSELIRCVTDDFAEKMRRCEEQPDKLFIKTADLEDVIAGAGTAGLEITEQVEGAPLDAVITPLSGGGLLSGTAIAVKHRWPNCKVIAAEPPGKNLERDLRAGRRDPQMLHLDTVAEAIRGKTVGELNFAVMCELVEKTVITVNDDEMRAAMRLLAERTKLVVEMAGAAPLAAALKIKRYFPDVNRVGVVLSGGNIDFDAFVANVKKAKNSNCNGNGNGVH